MLKLFGTTDTLYSSNGDKVIIPTKALIHKEDNGAFYLQVECSLSYIDDLTPNRLLVAPTPQGEQAFRIQNIDKRNDKLVLKAQHVFFDTMNYVIQDSYVVDKTCNDAIDHLNNATDNPSPFTTSSNIVKIASYRCVRKSLYEALQVVIERWGGHLVRNNFTFAINDSIGQDNGVELRYGKNIKSITASYDWSNVVTKLLPVGKDGLLLPDIYVTTDDTYDIPYTKVVSFNQDNVEEDNYKDEEGNLNEEAYRNALLEDLSSKAHTYLLENILPKVNYTLSANLEKLSDIGDVIKVYDEKLGIELLTNVISFDYDCLLGQYIEVQFGNFQNSLSNLMNTVNSESALIAEDEAYKVKVTLSDELKEATDTIWGVLGNSYVIVEGDKILVVDTLPKEAATNVIMINAGGIAFGNNGINGTFSSVWDINNTLNLENINVIGLTADLIKSGTLKLGNQLNQNGILEVYDNANNLIATMDKDGLRMNALDGGYIKINTTVGFSGYDRNDNRIYWVDGDSFHQKKSVIEEEITLVNKMRILPMTIYDANQQIVNDGIGFVSTL